MRSDQPRALLAGIVGGSALVGLFVAGLILLDRRTSEADLSYLENFRLPSGVEQQLADARARGIQGEINVTMPQLPPPWLKPELHGPFLFVPDGWIGDLPAGSEDRPFTPWDAPQPSAPPTAEDIRASALWRGPSYVPDGYALRDVASERLGYAVIQRWATAVAGHPDLEDVIELQWWKPLYLPVRIDTWADGDHRLFESTVVDGYPAVIHRAVAHNSTTVWIFDVDHGVLYVGQSGAVSSDELLAMVRSLYR